MFGRWLGFVVTLVPALSSCGQRQEGDAAGEGGDTRGGAGGSVSTGSGGASAAGGSAGHGGASGSGAGGSTGSGGASAAGGSAGNAGASGTGGGPAGGAAGTGGVGGAGPLPLVFSVMGDTPYGAADQALLATQLRQHDEQSPSRFLFHVGDIKTGASACHESVYVTVATLLAGLRVQTFVLVGDNEWNDCGGSGPGPAEAWGLWVKHLRGFHARWSVPRTVETQPDRIDNLAFVEESVLVVGVTMPGGRVHDPGEWNDFLDDGADWVESRIASHGSRVYAMVLLTHANPGSNHARFMTRFRAAASSFAKPVLFVHGDGHVWIDDRPWSERNVRRIQVDQGGRADPLQVTVSPGAADPFSVERDPLR